jgi:hypothetical protein
MTKPPIATCDQHIAPVVRRCGLALIAVAVSLSWPGSARSGPADDSPLSQLLGIAQQAPMAFPDTLMVRSKTSAQIWGPLFQAQVSRCWQKPDSGKEPRTAETVLRIKLARSGTLDGTPTVVTAARTPYTRAFEHSAIRAVIACQPYHLPDAFFDEWRHFEPVFAEP